MQSGLVVRACQAEAGVDDDDGCWVVGCLSLPLDNSDFFVQLEVLLQCLLDIVFVMVSIYYYEL